ncbi:MAG: class I SAM-dependent methyltransferase [Pseudomonadales bacterium]
MLNLVKNVCLVFAIGSLGLHALSAFAGVDPTLQGAIEGSQRSAENRARDRWRHPAETLTFFGVRADMTVLEISPGGGWYTEILAPYLREQGTLYAAAFPGDIPGEEGAYYRKSRAAFEAKLAASPTTYDRVKVTDFLPPSRLELAPAGSVDLVLTFRNVHNWLDANGSDALVLAAAFTALKPGGVLGIVEHRTPREVSRQEMAERGYMSETAVIAAAEKAGFVLEAKSEINANSLDTRDHPAGVWTLPPSLALGAKDREKYIAIGETDRMTLRFRKPAQ